MRVLSVAWAAVLHCPPGWGDFYDSLALAVDAFNEDRFVEVVNETRDLLLPLAKKPPRALECPSAMASTFLLLARASEQLARPRVGRAARQAALLFAASDAVELGTAYVDATPWPLTWREVSSLPPYAGPAFPRDRNATGPGLRVAVVSVCAPGTGSFGRSSRANKEAYARRHGYGLEVFDDAPWLEDGLAAPSAEKAAWSKLDALLRVAAKGEYDWALWLDCDALVANPSRRVEDLRLPAVSDAEKTVVREMGAWSAGTGTGARRSLRDMIAAFDSFLTSKMPKEKERKSDKLLTHRRLGWSGRLFNEPTPNILMSEDGLFPQTAAMLVRMSPWSFWALQKARALALQTPAVALHPWKERVPVWWLFSFPVLMRALRVGRDIETGYVPAVHEVTAKELITFPPPKGVAVDHPQFAPGDWLVGMQGCVGIGDELCAHLARQYTG